MVELANTEAAAQNKWNLKYLYLGFLFGLLMLSALNGSAKNAFARDVDYKGSEEIVYVRTSEPTQVTFPGTVEGGFKRKNTSLSLERQNNFLVVFANASLPPDGEAIIVQLDDKRTYALRVKPEDAASGNTRDNNVNIVDNRVMDEVPVESPTAEMPQPGLAPSNPVAGLMRDMVLIAEFGKGKAPAGFRRSNRFTNEVILNDGSMEAKIDEMFLGTDLTGYVISVENMLESTQRLNPATFRLDGTRAVSAQYWELAPRPLTAEQQISNRHRSKVYIVTRSTRR